MKELIHVDRVLHLHSLEHAVQENEGPCPPHPGTAVHEEGETIIFVVPPLHTADEADEGGGKLWDAMVRPGSEVIMCHPQWFAISLCMTW